MSGRGRLARYAIWQAHDYVFERGIPTLIVGVLLLLPPMMAARAMGGTGWLATAEGGALARGIVGSIVEPFALFGALLATNGIVANERRHGYFRFLFAKPIRVPQYYLQAYVVHWLGVLAATVALQAMVALVLRPVAIPGVFAFVATVYLAFGGMVFFASTLVRLDWVIAGALWGAGIAFRIAWPPERGGIGAVLHVILPPSHLAGEVREALLAGRAPVPALLWFAGYGLIAVAAAWIVLRRRPLAA